jgi:hypothetical protein
MPGVSATELIAATSASPSASIQRREKEATSAIVSLPTINVFSPQLDEKTDGPAS